MNFLNTMDDTTQGNKSRQLASTGTFHKFIVIQSRDEHGDLSKLSPFVIDKFLKAKIGTLTDLRRLRGGQLLVKTDSETYSKKLLGLSDLAGVPVKATPHRTLNSSKGVVRCGELKHASEEEIISELADQGVVDCFNIKVKGQDGVRRKTNTYILTFSTSTLPKHIKIGFIHTKVEIYIPNPLRCFQCQKYGHSKNVCRNAAVCARCGEQHQTEGCTNPEKCANCSGAHPAYHKDCPKWLLEKEVQQVKIKNGVSFVEARRIVTSQQATIFAKPSAATVLSRSLGSQSTRQTTNQSTTCSVQTQTDLTWPLSSDKPIRTSDTATQTNAPHMLPPARSDIPPRTKRDKKRTLSAETPALTVFGAEGSSKSPPSNSKEKTAKAPRILRPFPPRHTEDPVAMYNKYGVLDQEGDDAHFSDT